MLYLKETIVDVMTFFVELLLAFLQSLNHQVDILLLKFLAIPRSSSDLVFDLLVVAFLCQSS